MGKKRKNKEIEFVMETDWLFEKPIDKEHKEYILLGYFQKMGEKLDRMELYPGFIEISLHLASIQTLIKERKLIYTNKKFDSIDDELLVRDLKVKDIPEMTTEETKEFVKILTYSAPRLLEYFNLAKSIWSLVFETIGTNIKKNKKNVDKPNGYFFYNDKQNNKLYVWEYEIKSITKRSPEQKTFVNLIYSDSKGDLTIPKIISTFTQWNEDKSKSTLPVFEMVCNSIFPVQETLLPLFKRKLMTYVNQSVPVNKVRIIKKS